MNDIVILGGNGGGVKTFFLKIGENTSDFWIWPLQAFN